MQSEHRNLIVRWLEAESRDAEPEAERALTALLRHLRYEAPPATLVAGVMQRIGPARRRVADLPVGWRVALLAAMVLVAAAVGWLPAVLLALPSPVGASVAAIADLVAVAAEWLAGGLSLWRLLVTIGDKAALVLATPESAVALVASVLLGAASLRLLYGLAHLDRRTVRAD